MFLAGTAQGASSSQAALGGLGEASRTPEILI
jgi:hypothetical protein